MSKARMLFLILVGLLLSGCSSLKAYKSSSERLAVVTIETKELNADNLWFSTYDIEGEKYSCDNPNVTVYAILNNISVISAYGDKGKNTNSVTFDIDAEKEFRITTIQPLYNELKNGKFTYYYCIPYVSFTPESDKNYKVVHGYDGEFCRMSVFEVRENGSEDKVVNVSEEPICPNKNIFE
ncbi:hypothetical protein RZY48_003876 [Vibrio navarrensis]|uniref:Lipoprotein n=1 Tax=Vibrio navarrensis TaxID=29495 RepID=A0AAI9CY62_9VIBR|nr:hypothetical protein [Vibrio navarrensis]